MLNETTGTRRPQPSFVQAVHSPVEAVNVTARRIRRTRAHGFLALPDGSSQPWFDQLSRDLMRLLVVDPGVLSFTPRPTNFKFTIDGGQVEHIPDFQVRHESGTALVDIERYKRDSSADNPHIEDLPFVMAQICQRHGVHYARILPSTIYAEPRWANVCELLRYKSVELTPELTFQAIDLLSRRNGTTTIAEAQAILGGRELGLPRIYAMALRKFIALDMSKPFGMQTTIRLLAENVVRQ